MRIRIWDKLLLALCGILLCGLAVLLLLWKGGSIHPLDLLTVSWLLTICVSVVVVLLGVYCISFLWRTRRNKRGFVIQRTENGELSISIKAMEGMVQQCVDKHNELEIQNTRIENTRDGVVVELRVSLAHGVSIPLAVNTLQKQIRQYVTSCSGVDVYEVRVEVESADMVAEETPFSVPEMPVANLSKESEAVREAAPIVAVPMPAAAAPEAEDGGQSHKSIHQRLFGKKAEEAIVPPPPVEKDEEAHVSGAAPGEGIEGKMGGQTEKSSADEGEE